MSPQQASVPAPAPAPAPACSTCVAPSARCASARQQAWRRCCWLRASLGSAGASQMHASWYTSPSVAHRQVVQACQTAATFFPAAVCQSAHRAELSVRQHTGGCMSTQHMSTQQPVRCRLSKRPEGCPHSQRTCFPVLPLHCGCMRPQGQASDILIQAKEIERLRDLLIALYVKHCGQETESVCECVGLTAEMGCFSAHPLTADHLRHV